MGLSALRVFLAVPPALALAVLSGGAISVQLRNCSPQVPRTVSHMRRDDASPASVSSFGGGPVSVAIPASDGELKLFVELPLAASSFPSQHCCCILHCSPLPVSSAAFHTHVVAVLPANISGLSR